MRSGNSATTGPSISALHLHLIDMGRFSLQFYTTGSNVAQKGTGCPPPRVRAGAADWPVLKRGKALISGKSRAGCHAIARVCHARNSKGEPVEEPVAVPAARRCCGNDRMRRFVRRLCRTRRGSGSSQRTRNHRASKTRCQHGADGLYRTQRPRREAGSRYAQSKRHACGAAVEFMHADGFNRVFQPGNAATV